MWLLLVVALFPNGALKGPSQSYLAQHVYETRVECEEAAWAFNKIDFAEAVAPEVKLRAVCVSGTNLTK